jgi:hypothetical protein
MNSEVKDRRMCGAEIPKERLDVIPTPKSVSDAARRSAANLS